MASALKDIVDRIDVELNLLDGKRETALKESREIIRRSASLIMACHRGDPVDGLKKQWEDVMDRVHSLKEEVLDVPELYYSGFVENAQVEAVEAGVVMQLKLHVGSSDSDILPELEEMGVRNTAYLKGLGDSVGELRRFCLEMLRKGEVERAGWYYGWMEEIYSRLTGLSYSHVSSELRRKMDTARVLLERTLGELVNIQHMDSLEKRLGEGNG